MRREMGAGHRHPRLSDSEWLRKDGSAESKSWALTRLLRSCAIAVELAAAAPSLRLYTGSDILFGALRLAALRHDAGGGAPSPLHGVTVTSILANVSPHDVVFMATTADVEVVAAAHARG